MIAQSELGANIMRMKMCSLVFILAVIVSTAKFSTGQQINNDKPKPCNEKIDHRGKYKVLSASPGGLEAQFYIEIDPKYRDDKNYLAIAKEFKTRFCHENRLRVIYLTGKKQWLILDPFDLGATPLAIYYTGEGTEEKEGLDVYSVVDGKVESRKLKIDD